MTTCALARLPPPRAAVFATSRGASRRRCWRRAASTDPGAASSPTVNAPVRFDLDLSDDEREWLEARDEFRVLVLGKTGVGKSTMINALVDGNSPIGALEVGTTQCLRFENELNDARVMVCDAPGFFDVEGRTPAGVLRELSANVADYHAVVYAHVATDRRLRLEDEQSVDFVVRALGPALASRVVVALTYANEIPRPHRADDDDDDDARAAILETRAAQLRALFRAAAERAGGTPRHLDAVDDAPHVAVGAPGDGWESTMWSALVRRAKIAADADDAPQPADGSYDATAREFDVDWDGLRATGIVVEGKSPPPPPPLELVRAFVESSSGEYVARDGARRSLFAARQRGMPSGFAATIVLEVRGDLEAPTSTCIRMLMPGAATGTIMAVPMGSLPAGDVPAPAALRRGGAEVTVGALSTTGGGGKSGPVTFKFDPSDGSFSSDAERWCDGRVIEIDADTGDAVVYARAETRNDERADE